MDQHPVSALGKRERQIMEIIYRRGIATAAEVHADLPDAPTYSAVRGMLRHLEEKGHLAHEQSGPRYVYRATVPTGEVRQSALAHVVRTFFDDSAATAVAALLSAKPLTSSEYERLSRLLEEARLPEDEE